MSMRPNVTVALSDGGGGGSITSYISSASYYLGLAEEEAKKLTSELMSDTYYTVGAFKDNLDTELKKLRTTIDDLETKNTTRKNYHL